MTVLARAQSSSLLTLEAERLARDGTRSRRIDEELLASLAIEGQRERRRRETLRAAGEELVQRLPRYERVALVQDAHGWRLEAHCARRRP